MNAGETIEVATGARLHFGLICGTEDAGWKFGGVGLMVREPGWRIRISASGEPCQIRGAADNVTQRIRSLLSHCRQLNDGTSASFSVDVAAHIPLHAGYGAGTQLALAVAAAVHTLVRRRFPDDLGRLSELLGRAGRSAIGTAGFQSGGFLVDRGVPATGRGPSVDRSSDVERVQRVSIPDEWRFVLIRPIRYAGLSGAEERAFFDRRQTMAPAEVRTLFTLIEKQLLPAVSGNDFPQFAAALAEYGRAAGSFYAAQQGDIFSHPTMRRIADHVTACGFPGAAQSSWGPGICIPAANTDAAHHILQLIQSHPTAGELSLQITEPLNSGASLRSRAPEQNHAGQRV